MKKIAFITGANKGLGFETAKQLTKAGIKVLVGARNFERGTTAVEKLNSEGIDAEFVQIDMADSKSIEEAVKYINSKYSKLDILVNNAGMVHKNEEWQLNTVNTISQEILKETFETNFFGLVNLTQQLIPLIKKSKQGNIVNVSSILGSLTVGNDASSMYYTVKPFSYDASKAALNSFTIHLAASLKEHNITVNSAHPGWVKTDLGTEHAPLNVEEGAKTIVDLALNKKQETSKFVHLGEEIAW